MADTLVERLRQADTNSQQRVLGSRIFGEAADLIAALERQLAEARAATETQAKLYRQALARAKRAEAERDRLAADNARLREGFADPDLLAMSNGVISLHYEDLDAAQSAFDWLDARAALAGKE